MSFETRSQIKELLDQYRELCASSSKRSIDLLMTEPEDFAALLHTSVSRWREAEANLKQATRRVTPSEVLDDQIGPNISTIASEISQLLTVLETLKRSIGPIVFEDVHEKIVKEVESTIDRFDTLLESAIGQFPANEDFIRDHIRNVQLQNTLQSFGLSQLAREITSAAQQPLPQPRSSLSSKRNWLDRVFLDTRDHLWLQLLLLSIILFLAFTRSRLADVLITWTPWIHIAALGLIVILLARSVRSGRWRAVIYMLIIGGLVSLWIFGMLPGFEALILPSKSWAKLFLWITVLFWFPVQFLGVAKGYRSTQMALLAVLWSAVLALWAYGVIRGMVLALLLLVFPIRRLLRVSKREQRQLAGVLDRRLYYPTAIALLIASLIVTGEAIWLRGVVIWSLFSITAMHSFKYFRKTYDLIEDIFPDAAGRQQRHQLIFWSLGVTTILLFPGVLGELEQKFVAELYLQAAGLAFGLITILLAVQAIIPGITTWFGENNPVSRLREMRSILRASAGLEGFMQWFFLLFLLSLLGWLITSRFLAGLPVVVDLSFDSAFAPALKLPILVGRFVSFSSGSRSVLVTLSTLAFSAFVYVIVYGIAQLYYLFIAANALTLPIRDSLLSTPVVIEEIKIQAPDSADDMIAVKRVDWEKKLRRNKDFNGLIVNRLVVESSDQRLSTIDRVLLEVEMDFVELKGLLDLVKRSLSVAFSLGNVQNAELTVSRKAHGPLWNQKVLSLEISKEEWAFLGRETPGFPFDYKLHVLGARITDYVLAESQIA